MISTIEKVLFLKRVDLFRQIPGEDLAQVAQIAKEVYFEQGQQIIKQGDVGDCLYLIIEGEVKVLSDDKEITRFGEKESVGEMSILDAEPRSASVFAVSDVVLLKIKQEDFYEMISERPEIAQGVIKVLTRRLRRNSKSEKR
jgi:CRP-like cAMP-binding protein